MRQVKIFKGLESAVSDLESEINQWLSSSGATVVDMVGNIAPQTAGTVGNSGGISGGGRSYGPSDIVIVILYEPAG